MPSVRHGSRARSSLSSGYKAGMRRVQDGYEAGTRCRGSPWSVTWPRGHGRVRGKHVILRPCWRKVLAAVARDATPYTQGITSFICRFYSLIHLFINESVHCLFVHLFIHPCMHLYLYLCIYLFINVSFSLSIYLFDCTLTLLWRFVTLDEYNLL